MNLLHKVNFDIKQKTITVYVFVCLSFHLTASANVISLAYNPTKEIKIAYDSVPNPGIRRLLSEKTNAVLFHFPNTVKRFYAQRGFRPAWTDPNTDVRQTSEAMMLLDCVLQYGLFHKDYHPDYLTYELMHQVFEKSSKAHNKQQAMFDVMLTDALITLINNLHYGKLNPIYTITILDKGKIKGFDAADILRIAKLQIDFNAQVLSVQPKSKRYVLMQDYMRLIKGQYVGDCYETPEKVVRKLAINMERLRWLESNKNKPLPLEFTHLTCEILDGQIVSYDDIYHRDHKLEQALYQMEKSPLLPKIKMKQD
jgi:murein L,D-transpeptidase YcbB/YkuD